MTPKQAEKEYDHLGWKISLLKQQITGFEIEQKRLKEYIYPTLKESK